MSDRSLFRAALMVVFFGARFGLGLVASADDRIGGQFGGGVGNGHSHGGTFGGGSALPYGWNLPASGFHNPIPSFGGAIQPSYYGSGAVTPYYAPYSPYYSGGFASPRLHSNSWNGSYDNFKFNTVGPPSAYSPFFLRGSVAGVFVLSPQHFATGYSIPVSPSTGRYRYRPLNYGYGGLGYGSTGFVYRPGAGQ